MKLWAERAAAAQSGDVRNSKIDAFRRLFGVGGLVRPVTDQGVEIVALKDADTNRAQVAVDAIRSFYGPDSARTRTHAPHTEPWSRSSPGPGPLD